MDTPNQLRYIWNHMNDKGVPDEKRVVSTARDILDMLEESGRELTRNDVVAVIGNVTSNVIMAVSQVAEKEGGVPAQAGAVLAVVTAMVNHHVELMIEQAYGDKAVDLFNESRFTVMLECVSLPRGDGRLSELQRKEN